jgi:hypothetical protein
MHRTLWLGVLALPMIAVPAYAEITEAILGVKGAEMT